jgi:hypothetical protein
MFAYIPRWLLWLGGAVIASALASAAIFLYLRYAVSDADRVRDALDTAAMAVEQKAPRLLLAQIDDAYHDDFSGLDKEKLRDYALAWARQHFNVEVKVALSDFQFTPAPEGDRATMAFTVDGNEPIRRIIAHFKAGDRPRLRAHFVKRPDGWLIDRVEIVKAN